MMTRLFVGLLLCPLVALADAEVKLPLSTYDRMKAEANRTVAESTATVDRLRFGGSFEKNDLFVVLTGRASGPSPSVSVMNGGPSLRLYDCSGDGLVTREGEVFWVTPSKAAFTVRCSVSGQKDESLEITTTPSAPWAESDVSDAEFAAADVDGGGLHLAFSRTGLSPVETVPPTATGRYAITLQPNATHFTYRLQVHSANRGHAPFHLDLKGNERVTRVASDAPHTTEGDRHTFDVPSGDTTITFEGTIPDGVLIPPVDSPVQYAVLESEPSLRATVEGAPARISLPETGMKAQYSGAQAFLLGSGERLHWTTRRLTYLPTPGLAIPEAAHTFFITRDGDVVGESAFNINNQGATSLPVPMQAKPTFAAIRGDAVPLTRNTEGHLWLPLTAGAQWIEMQFRGGLAQRMGFAWGRLWLPQVSQSPTLSQIDVRYPADWVPLVERFQSDLRVRDLEPRRVLWSLGIAVAACLGLLVLRFNRRRSLALAALLCVGAQASDMLFRGIAAVVAAIAIIWLVRRAASLGRWRFALAGLVGFVGMLVMFVPQSTLVQINRAELPAPHGPSKVTAEQGPSTELCNGLDNDCDGTTDNYLGNVAVDRARNGSSVVAENANYQGLPARVRLPNGRTLSTFHAELLATDAPQGVQVLLVSRRVLSAASIALLLLIALVFARERTRLQEGCRALLST
jgi:hypothetical protein